MNQQESKRRWLFGCIFILVTLLIIGWFGPMAPSEFRNALQSPDFEKRKQAAWAFADAPANSRTRDAAALLNQIRQADVPPDVLESYIYAVGRHYAGTGVSAEIIVERIQNETPDFPRQAAWLALARIAPNKYRTLADEYAQSENDWDHWGMLRGRLELGDYSDIVILWKWGASDDWDRRQHTARVANARLAPLLETQGRWPIELEDRAPDTWMSDDFETLRAQVAMIDLVALAEDCLPHFERSRDVRSTMGKVTGGRDRIKRWLFGS